MKKEKPSGSAFPIAVFLLVLGCIQTAINVPIVFVASPTPLAAVALIGMCLASFGGATVFFWEHRRDKKYDVLIEQENRERERQLQEQANHQH